MDDETCRILRDSWEHIRPVSKDIAVSFYERLFAQNPAIARLFVGTDMLAQRDKFMVMLSEIVRVIDQPEQFASTVADSGRRHIAYGVRNRDYADVGAALLFALEQNLGDAYTPAVGEAWREAYELLSGVMRRAAD
jgi:hemoglobin-like flavoprotein